MDVGIEHVTHAATALAGVVHRTPVMGSRRVDDWAGARVSFKCEHLQRCGAFKFRGAANAVRFVEPGSAGGVAAHSSGNHAAALALAARERGVDCTVVMPAGTPEPKRAAVHAYGARIVECEPTLEAREATVADVIADSGAVEIHPYDNPRVIAGAGTAALEFVSEVPALDALVVPIGGGGLSSGTCLAVAAMSPTTKVIGAEPVGADDAARSLTAGELIPQTDPDTIADGLRTSLSERTFAILSDHLHEIVTVTDDETIAAMRLTWSATKQLIEPSSAVAVAALAHLDGYETIGVILTGGNVDLDAMPY